MQTTPTIILVHGFWGGAAHWAKVIIHLSRMGHRSVGRAVFRLAQDGFTSVAHYAGNGVEAAEVVAAIEAKGIRAFAVEGDMCSGGPLGPKNADRCAAA